MNGIREDLSFDDQLEIALKTKDPDERFKFIAYRIFRMEESVQTHCKAQKEECCNWMKTLENAQDEVLWTIWRKLPSWAQKMVIICTALYLVCFGIVTGLAVYLIRTQVIGA